MEDFREFVKTSAGEVHQIFQTTDVIWVYISLSLAFFVVSHFN